MLRYPKKCSWCGQIKPLTKFYKKANAKDGRTGYCKECSSNSARKAQTVGAGRRGNWEERETLRKAGKKRCGRCGKILPFSEFYKDRRKLDGCYLYCKKCHGAVVNGDYVLSKKDHCEACGFIPIDSCQLSIDHKDEHHSNDTPDNLWTLCANCHWLKSVRPLLFWEGYSNRRVTVFKPL